MHNIMEDTEEIPNFGDNFIRPGEPGFTSFPKHLPEDCVSYTIHVLGSSNTPPSAHRSRLVEIQKAATSLARSLLKDYIWQRESFNLALSPNTLQSSLSFEQDGKPQASKSAEDSNPTQDSMLHLSGCTNFGDSIADEWLIVYLLRELSKTFEDAWIRVWDADGEFLLAEAAQKLPKWLNPEIAEHRIWINKGRLLVIPRTISPHPDSGHASPKAKPYTQSTQVPRHLTLSTALDILQKYPSSSLLHDPSIEAEAFQRIHNYPADIKLSMHTSRIPIPRNLAYILHRCPSHISPAIEAFYLRDHIALKPLGENAIQDDLFFRPQDCVNVSVKFPRVGFAQLRSQEFQPPKPWRSFVSDSVDDLPTRQKKELSMKLCCGFEMLLQDPKNKDDRPVREINLLIEDLENEDDRLPTDQEIGAWDQQNDSESWLDIDFTEFEKKLSGQAAGGSSGTKTHDNDMWGFKDKATEEKTRILMERLLSLMGEDDEGGTSEDEMDFDDDDEDDDDDDEDQDNELNDANDPFKFGGEGSSSQPFDDAKFRGLKKKLGLPSDSGSDAGSDHRIEELDSDDAKETDDPTAEAEKLQKVMADMEAELREAGFFDQ